mgnify:CR=1 FL=1
MKETKPIIAVDRSGDFNNTPIAIAFSYQKTNVNINNIIDEIRDIAIKNNKNLIGRKFIKAIDIENEYAQEQVMKVIEKNFNFKCAVFFPKAINYCKDKLFPSKHWNFKIEAIFYFKLLSKALNFKRAVLDEYYRGNMDSLLVPLIDLFYRLEKGKPYGEMFDYSNSRSNLSIQICDLIAGFLRNNGKLRRTYKNHVFIYRKNPNQEFDNIIKELK